jgi:nitrogen fixation NifU-like protein
MRLEQMYQEVILDHYRNPHGCGLREPFDAEAYHINPTCGDEVTLRVKLSGDGAEGAEATIVDVSYDALGCSISQAATSVLNDLVVGRSVADSLRILEAYQEMAQGRGQVEPDEEVLGDAIAFAGVARYPARVKCALLGWMAFKDAVLRGTNGGGGPASIAAREERNRSGPDHQHGTSQNGAGA